MNRIFGLIILVAIMLSGCIVGLSGTGQETQEPIELLIPTQTETPKSPTPKFTQAISPRTDDCQIRVEKIADSARLFSWSAEQDKIYFSQDPNMLVWRVHPDQSDQVELQTVFPVLDTRVVDSIQFFSPNYPIYSISPSGEKVVFWERAFTKPTPTPADSEVPLTGFEWFFDLYLFSTGSQSHRLVTRVEGGLVDTYWSKDERFVFLLFDQLQIPGDYFLVQIDLSQGSMDVILSDINGDRYDNWIALSPDDDWLAYRFRKDPTTVHLINLRSGVMDKVTNMPEFDSMYWAKDDLWVLIEKNNSGANFIVFDSSMSEIMEIYNFNDRIGFLSGMDKPTLSPGFDKLAFFGSIDQKSNSRPLYIFSLCE